MTATNRNWWDQAKAGAPQAAVLAVVGAGAIITSAISYQHEYALARHNGQVRWVSSLLPFSVDGMVFAAGVALMWAAMHGVRGWRQLWQPRAVLAVGVAATIAANFFSDLGYWWLGPVVSASSGLALVLMSAVAFWLLAEQRKVSTGVGPQPAAACSHPPPPVSLAEALPLARAWLQETGERYGEEALAERFGVSRHVVRSALANDRGRGGTAPVPATQNAPAGMAMAVAPHIPGRGPGGHDGSRAAAGDTPAGVASVPPCAPAGAPDRGQGGLSAVPRRAEHSSRPEPRPAGVAAPVAAPAGALNGQAGRG